MPLTRRFGPSVLSFFHGEKGCEVGAVYVKLFSKILDSSIWLESDATRIVWITLLASMNEDGYAHFSSLKNLAQRANVTLQETVTAVEILSSPDKESADTEEDGRRIERVPGGFVVLNAEKYRKIKDRDFHREQTRERVRKYRERKKSNAKSLHSVTQALPSVTSVSVYASASAFTSASKNSTKNEKHSRVGNGRTTLEEAKAYCLEIGLLESDGQWFFDKCEGCGWKNNGKAIVDWKATVRAWKGISIFPGQKIMKVESKQELIDKSFDKLKEKYTNEARAKT